MPSNTPEQQEKFLYEVQVVRKRQGREHKHRVMAYIVLATDEMQAYEQVEDWTGLSYVSIRASHPVVLRGETECLTDAELIVVETEGWNVFKKKQRAELEAKITELEATIVALAHADLNATPEARS